MSNNSTPTVIQIYKSLDKTNSFFGLIGSYQRYFVLAAVGELVLCLAIGNVINSLIALILFLLMGGATYLATRYIQAKFSDKQRARWMCSHALPDYIIVKPVSLRKVVEALGVRFKETKPHSKSVS